MATITVGISRRKAVVLAPEDLRRRLRAQGLVDVLSVYDPPDCDRLLAIGTVNPCFNEDEEWP